MKVILNTENAYQAVRLRELIIRGIKKELDNVEIDTWAYTKSAEEYDIIYHNLPQYVNDPDKNVLFRLVLDGANVIFKIVWWKGKPEPDEKVKSLHMGRLVEMLLSHFMQSIIKLSIVD